MTGAFGRAATALLLAAAALAPGSGGAARGADLCGAPPGLLTLGPSLLRAAARLERREPLTIVAVGSSSTLGVGASASRFSYPSRLARELAARLPDTAIRVVNRGRSGEDAPEEVARLKRDVVPERPDLVIWQVGTNAVLRRDDLATDEVLVRQGIALLSAGASDVVLMDLQYAPRVLARRSYPAMERLIAEAAAEADAGLFRRFEIMRWWQAAAPADAGPVIAPDGLHLNDRGYACLAADLGEALMRNWRGHAAALAAGAGSDARRAVGALRVAAP